MSSLPPFSGDEPTCLKCGYAGARTEYRALGICEHNTDMWHHNYTLNERLHRECQRCRHAWDEAVVPKTSCNCPPTQAGLTLCPAFPGNTSKEPRP